MPEDNENKKRFIKIPKKDKEKIRVMPRGGGRGRQKISKQDFSNKITKAVSLGSIRLEELSKTYFLLDLHYNYYSKNVKDTLKKLNLKIETVFSSKRIFVSAETAQLQKSDINELPKYVFKTIENIEIIDSSDRIGQNLRKILLESTESETFKINIKTYGLKEFDDSKFIDYFKTFIPDDFSYETFKYITNTGVISCSCSKSSIEKLSKLPFIKRIFLPPKPVKMDHSSQPEPIYINEDLIFEKNETEELPLICIIDSGISNIFEEFIEVWDNNIFLDNDDRQDHGTKVASLALFGLDLLNMETRLENNLKIISYKIEDDNDSPLEIELTNEIIKAIEKYKNKTKIFSISYAYLYIDIEAHIEFLNILDKKIQEENVIACISAGNISRIDVQNNISNYPDYLVTYPVFCPSDGKNIIAVGSICYRTIQNNELFLSPHSRLGLSPLLITKMEKRTEFFKPNVHTFGGSNLTLGSIDHEHQIPVIDKYGNMVYEVGTSFATPLIASIFARLYNLYELDYSNSETFKAILLNRCKCNVLFNIPIFYIDNLENIFYCNNDFLFNFEGELEPLIRIEDRRDKKKEAHSGGFIARFYLPKEAESLDIVTVHSSNYENNSILYHNTRLIVRIVKSNGSPLKKKHGTPNRFVPITYGHYKFRRNFEGITTCEITSETRGISNDELVKVKIRFGVSIRVNLYDKYKYKFDKIFENLKNNLKTAPSIKVFPQISLESFIKE